MNNTIIALTGYISWILVLLVILAAYRTQFAKKNQKSLKFKSDGSDTDALGERITRAQANCVESFSFIGGTMLLAIATGASVITDGLALYVLVARLAQSIVHLSSTSNMAIQIRFVFFLIQVVICIYWLYSILMKFL